MTPEQRHTCQGINYDATAGKVYACGATAVYRENGKWYCFAHVPLYSRKPPAGGAT